MTAEALPRGRTDRAPPLPAIPVEPRDGGPPPEPRGRPWVGWVVAAVVLLALVGGGYWWWAARAAGDAAAAGAGRGAGGRVVPVVAARAVAGDLPIYLTGLGSVAPLNTVTVRSRVDGELIAVDFEQGQDVEAGKVIARLDPYPFDAMIQQAEGQLAKDEAARANAENDVKRYTNAGEAVSRQQLETAQAALKQFAGAVQADQGALANARLQRAYTEIKAPLSGRIGLRLVDVGNIVHASDAGGLAVINQVKPITVSFTLPQDDIPKLTRRLREVERANVGKGPDEKKEVVEVDAFDRDLRAKIAVGWVLAVDNQVDPNSGTIRVKATFKNEDESLYPNQFVNARLLVDVRRHATLVPAAAIQRGPDSAFVYVVKPEGPTTAAAASRPAGTPAAGGAAGGGGKGRPEGVQGAVEVRKVIVGPAEADRVSIEDGLAPGEIVVTDGVDKLQAGSKVAAQFGPWTGTTRPAGEAGDGTGRRGSTRPTTGPGGDAEPGRRSGNGGPRRQGGGGAEGGR